VCDFYTVSHNINRIKGFIAKWYKKEKVAWPAPATRPPPNAGRPRAYEPEVALGKALDLVSQRAVSPPRSLDDLRATG